MGHIDKELLKSKKELERQLKGKPGFTGVSVVNKNFIVHANDKNAEWTKKIPLEFRNRTQVQENSRIEISTSVNTPPPVPAQQQRYSYA